MLDTIGLSGTNLSALGESNTYEFASKEVFDNVEDDSLDGLLVLHLGEDVGPGNDDDPDLILVDRSTEEAGSIVLLTDLFVDEDGDLERSYDHELGLDELGLANFLPDFMVAGDFNGDGAVAFGTDETTQHVELLLFDRTGANVCVRASMGSRYPDSYARKVRMNGQR